MKSDIEIANMNDLEPIITVAAKLGLQATDLEQYGTYKAKIKSSVLEERKNLTDGHLILVTSTNPTPYGEGKTTMSIGINDALCQLGLKSLVVLREPSLGPVFGIKGGATGGGYAQVVPMEEINLHFTGDMHAITACNNLLSAVLDNMLFQGNALNLDETQILTERCMDMNDRALRHITVGSSQSDLREDRFVITVATEIMAILCLATNLENLKERISHILIGFTKDGNPLYVSDLHCEGAMTLLLKDAIKPNLVQTLVGNPAIIHGGPFANIAHGCNSILATKLGLKLADYVVTEAGFGADLGAEKFMDIKCRVGHLKPAVIVLNTTIRSLKYNGNCPKELLTDSDLSYLEKGISNLQVHIENMKQYSNHVFVCLNHFITDTEEEIAFVKSYCEKLKVTFTVSKAHLEGGTGSLSVAKEIIKRCQEESTFQMMYEIEDSIKEKITKLSNSIYHASDVIYEPGVKEKIEKYEQLGYKHYPVCIAKTQYSISDDAKKLGYPIGHTMTVKDVKLCSGAEFIVVYMGNIMTMPGLSKSPSYLHMDIDAKGNITGLF